MDSVSRWLDSLGLGAYAELFRANDIDGDVLKHLTADDLRDIGVTSIGHRRKLLAAIEAMRGASAASSDDSLLSAEQRLISVLFSDLVGFTSLTNVIGSEAMHDLLGGYKDICVRTVEKFGGHVAKFLGDGVLATFGYPRTLEHDAERAVSAGLALVKAIGDLSRDPAQQLSVRVGIATGNVVVGAHIGEAAVEHGSLVGEAVNLAARVQAEAAPGEVVVTAATRAIVAAGFECVAMGPRTLKGFSQPVELYRVIGEASAGRFAPARSRLVALVGRDREMALLVELHRRSNTADGQVVVISGEAGYGKSRLAAEFLEQTRSGVPELRLRCSPYHSDAPFRPITTALLEFADVSSADTPEQQWHKIAKTLANSPATSTLAEERLASIGDLLGIATPDSVRHQAFSGIEARNRSMLDLLDILKAIAANGTILIEDMQWADPSTTEVLARLVPRMRDQSAMILATMRPGPLPHWASEPAATVITLDRLDREDAWRLAEAVAGETKLAPRVIEAVVNRADGVPLFLEELVRALAVDAPDTEIKTVEHVPSTLVDSLLARLDRMQHGREMAQVAAVLGREFPRSLLVAVAPLKPWQIVAGIEELTEAGVFVARYSVVGDGIGFRHALVRDAAYQSMLKRDRRRLHRHIADVVLERFPKIAATLPHVLAHQLTAADDYAAAIPLWRQAGQAAAAIAASREAMAHFDRAIELLHYLEPNEARDNIELDLTLDMVAPKFQTEGYFSAEREIVRAIELCGRLTAPYRAIPALTHRFFLDFSGGKVDAAQRHADAIAAAARPDNDVDNMIVNRVRGSLFLFTGEFEKAKHELLAFQRVYRGETHERELQRIGVTLHDVTVKLCLAEIYCLIGKEDEMRLWQAAALDAARAKGHVGTLCQTVAYAGGLLAAIREDAPALAAHANELRELIDRYEMPHWSACVDLLSGLAEFHSRGSAQALLLLKARFREVAFSALPMQSVWSIVFAAACLKAGLAEEGLNTLAQVEARVSGGERVMAAEFYRVRAGLSALNGAPASAVDADFDASLAFAREQMSELFEARVRADLVCRGGR